ncbi:uncharacterized protein BT62DRAFT_1072804 [Guyanagaster necrorhizus]|uniref:Uncharacterized protein n=1 Tax=Guyanagaster necrorhizus TaxID=856835 RepID=A0A9P8AWP2_9AGAR|nr:uncharacterized protein BT62DRAFT_1072804 [Guyanagaster necrorhizus MCA 3950]KAG7450783.1 hypothetical protein BT62DRAFT_1072804 [Guyanagaster necrorhizus MCA 3950]
MVFLNGREGKDHAEPFNLSVTSTQSVSNLQLNKLSLYRGPTPGIRIPSHDPPLPASYARLFYPYLFARSMDSHVNQVPFKAEASSVLIPPRLSLPLGYKQLSQDATDSLILKLGLRIRAIHFFPGRSWLPLIAFWDEARMDSTTQSNVDKSTDAEPHASSRTNLTVCDSESKGLAEKRFTIGQ